MSPLLALGIAIAFVTLALAAALWTIFSYLE